MSKTIFFSATVEGIRTRRDRTLGITLGTQELRPEKMAAVLTLQNIVAFVAIKPEDFGQEEAEAIEAAEADLMEGSTKKTASQRQRSVLFLYWKQDNQGFDDFLDFYRHEMERIITHYKNKLT